MHRWKYQECKILNWKIINRNATASKPIEASEESPPFEQLCKSLNSVSSLGNSLKNFWSSPIESGLTQKIENNCWTGHNCFGRIKPIKTQPTNFKKRRKFFEFLCDQWWGIR